MAAMSRVSGHMILLLVFCFIDMDNTEELHGEYCQHDVFEGRCDNEHVLLITRAQYGRMSLGKCVKTDFGFVGCYDDVTDILDRKCSGRHTCDVTIADPNFDNKRPCNEEFKNHLEVWYQCVPVHYPKAGSCDINLRTPVPIPSQVITNNPGKSTARGGAEALVSTTTSIPPHIGEGYLPSSIAEDTGCGSDASPWVIRVSQGQRLRITIYDFNIQPNVSPSNPSPQNSLICYKYGLLLEPHHRKSIDICAGNQREMLTYESKGETVHLTISRPGHSYMVKYKALGCPEIPSTAEMWFQRSEDTLDVGCYHSSQEWHLSCQDTTWVGELGNCTNKAGSKGEQSPSNGGNEGDFVLPPGLMIGVISVVAVCISLAIVIIGLICIKRVKYSSCKANSAHASDENNLHNAMQLNVCPTTKLNPAQPPDYTLKFNDDSYSHIFIPNNDCPLHSQAIYACKQHMSPQRGSGDRHSYGILHPMEHATIHEHIGTANTTSTPTYNTSEQSATLTSTTQGSNLRQQPQQQQQQMNQSQEFDSATLGMKQEEYYQLRANNAQNMNQQQPQQQPPPDLL